jgi:hypothetical protein
MVRRGLGRSPEVPTRGSAVYRKLKDGERRNGEKWTSEADAPREIKTQTLSERVFFPLNISKF